MPELRFLNPSIKFDHEINWKGLCLVVSDWRVSWISLLKRFCKSFTFLVTLLLKHKVLQMDFWELSFLILHFQSLGTLSQFLVKSRVGNETMLKKFTEVSTNYGKFICNIFGWNAVKIGVIRAKVQDSVWI